MKQGSREVPIQIKRGVKQGDPLSPFLFSSVPEPLILKLESQQGFKVINECNISSLAFADDIRPRSHERPSKDICRTLV
jgi:hypothetical protein